MSCSAQDDRHDRIKIHAFLDRERESLSGDSHVDTSEKVVDGFDLAARSDAPGCRQQ